MLFYIREIALAIYQPLPKSFSVAFAVNNLLIREVFQVTKIGIIKIIQALKAKKKLKRR